MIRSRHLNVTKEEGDMWSVVTLWERQDGNTSSPEAAGTTTHIPHRRRDTLTDLCDYKGEKADQVHGRAEGFKQWSQVLVQRCVTVETGESRADRWELERFNSGEKKHSDFGSYLPQTVTWSFVSELLLFSLWLKLVFVISANRTDKTGRRCAAHKSVDHLQEVVLSFCIQRFLSSLVFSLLTSVVSLVSPHRSLLFHLLPSLFHLLLFLPPLSSLPLSSLSPSLSLSP